MRWFSPQSSGGELTQTWRAQSRQLPTRSACDAAWRWRRSQYVADSTRQTAPTKTVQLTQPSSSAARTGASTYTKQEWQSTICSAAPRSSLARSTTVRRLAPTRRAQNPS